MSQQPHVEAYLALLAAVTVHVGEAPGDAAMPYVVLFPSMPLGTGRSLCGTTRRRGNDVQTTCVGATVEQAQWLAGQVQDALEDVRPTMPDKRCSLIHKDFSQPARADRDVTPPVFYAIDLWSFTAS